MTEVSYFILKKKGKNIISVRISLHNTCEGQKKRKSPKTFPKNKKGEQPSQSSLTIMFPLEFFFSASMKLECNNIRAVSAAGPPLHYLLSF